MYRYIETKDPCIEDVVQHPLLARLGEEADCNVDQGVVCVAEVLVQRLVFVPNEALRVNGEVSLQRDEKAHA